MSESRLANASKRLMDNILEFGHVTDNEFIDDVHSALDSLPASDDTLINRLWEFSDQYQRDTFRFWFTHVIYNTVKDIVCFSKVRRW